jgi:3-isopropylmalate/(R)-2-methylmalate dehydratase large subunit
MGLTAVEKLLAAKAGAGTVRPGEVVVVRPDLALCDEAITAIVPILEDLGAERLALGDEIMICLDHRAPAPSITCADDHRRVRQFVAKHGIEHFFDVGRGISLQLAAEYGLAWPGSLVVGSDSHTLELGGASALGVGISRTEMAVLMATGRIWLRVPESFRVLLEGKLRRGVSSKDVALRLMGDIGEEGAIYKSIEFSGSALALVSVDERLTLCNVCTEMGAKTTFVEPDARLLEWGQQNRLGWASKCPKDDWRTLAADPDATYERSLYYRIDEVEPLVSLPHSPGRVARAAEITAEKIDQAYLGTCTGGKLADLAAAASVVRGRQVKPGVRLLVSPASQKVYSEALQAGYIQALVESGAIIQSPGCGACTGIHHGTLGRGETCISAGARNYQGRMGSPEARIFLGSPYTVAASAIAGEICDPRRFIEA